MMEPAVGITSARAAMSYCGAHRYEDRLMLGALPGPPIDTRRSPAERAAALARRLFERQWFGRLRVPSIFTNRPGGHRERVASVAAHGVDDHRPTADRPNGASG